MKNKLKILILTIFSLLTFSFALLPQSVSAINSVCDLEDKSSVPQSVLDAAGCNNSDDDKLPAAVGIILNAIIGVSGVIAVIFIIIGGVNYMTSTGESAKIEKAKKTILYAVIGLIIVILAAAIVNFTIARVNDAQSSTNQTSSNNSGNSTNKTNSNKNSNKK